VRWFATRRRITTSFLPSFWVIVNTDAFRKQGAGYTPNSERGHSEVRWQLSKWSWLVRREHVHHQETYFPQNGAEGAGATLGLPFLAPWCPPVRLLPKPPRCPRCGQASSIFPTARSCTTRRMGRPWINGRPAVPAPISSSARSSPRSNRTRSMSRLSAIWRTRPARARFIPQSGDVAQRDPSRHRRSRAHMATTLDQVIAKVIGQDTPLPSLEVSSETTVQVAAGGGG
jgi:hypothetical protein